MPAYGNAGYSLAQPHLPFLVHFRHPPMHSQLPISACLSPKPFTYSTIPLCPTHRCRAAPCIPPPRYYAAFRTPFLSPAASPPCNSPYRSLRPSTLRGPHPRGRVRQRLPGPTARVAEFPLMEPSLRGSRCPEPPHPSRFQVPLLSTYPTCQSHPRLSLLSRRGSVHLLQ